MNYGIVFWPKSNLMLFLFSRKHSFSLHKMLIDWLEWWGLLRCIYQLFRLSFWRHPFTAEDPLVSKWCNATCKQIWSDEETNSSTSWMAWGYVNIQHIFFRGGGGVNCSFNVCPWSFLSVYYVILSYSYFQDWLLMCSFVSCSLYPGRTSLKWPKTTSMVWTLVGFFPLALLQ